MKKYQCVVTPDDTLVAYITDMEPTKGDLFALVCENQKEQIKVSVLLNKQDAILLREQLETFIIQSNINRN